MLSQIEFVILFRELNILGIAQVFLPGVAFTLPGSVSNDVNSKNGLVRGLSNINKIGAVTTYGASESTVLWCNDNARSFLSRGLRPLCNPKCLISWHGLYNMDAQTVSARKKFLDDVTNSYSKW